MGHEVKKFDCGNNDLNIFLQTTAGQHQRKFISKTYVLVDDEAPTQVMGFYTIAVRRMVAKDDLPPAIAKKLPREVPGFSLARLAVRDDLKGQGHGEYLMAHAIDRTARVASEIGGYAVFVDAKDEQAAAFYQRYGFAPMPDNPLILCLPFANMPK
jgi:GNAT superfamily N-acetyltransferase